MWDNLWGGGVCLGRGSWGQSQSFKTLFTLAFQSVHPCERLSSPTRHAQVFHAATCRQPAQSNHRKSAPWTCTDFQAYPGVYICAGQIHRSERSLPMFWSMHQTRMGEKEKIRCRKSSIEDGNNLDGEQRAVSVGGLKVKRQVRI